MEKQSNEKALLKLLQENDSTINAIVTKDEKIDTIKDVAFSKG